MDNLNSKSQNKNTHYRANLLWALYGQSRRYSNFILLRYSDPKCTTRVINNYIHQKEEQ